MSEHTKTPWEYYVATMGGDEIAVIHQKGEPDNYRICTMFDEGGKGTTAEANARHIVHCVNNMPKVVEALRDMVELDDCSSPRMYIAATENARTLLSALEAEKGGEL